MRKVVLSTCLAALLAAAPGAAAAQESDADTQDVVVPDEGFDELEAPPEPEAVPGSPEPEAVPGSLEPEEPYYGYRASHDPGRRGLYFGAGATFAVDFFDIDDAKRASGIDLDATNSWGVNGRIGYRAHRHLAVETTFEYYQGFDLDGPEGTDVVEISGWSLMLGGKGYILTGRIQPYGSLGAGVLRLDRDLTFTREFTVPGISGRHALDGSDLAFASRYGVGVDLYAFHDVIMNVEYSFTLPTGPLNDMLYTSLAFGLQYRF